MVDGDAEGVPSETDADIGKMSFGLMEDQVMDDIASMYHVTCLSNDSRVGSEISCTKSFR